MAVNVRERLQQHIIDNAKYGGARTNSQRERQDRGSNESAVLEHGPKTEADILNQRFNEPSGAHIPAFFFHLIEAAEFQPCPTPRLFQGHASGHEIGNPLIEMEAKLGIEMFLSELSAEESLVPAHRSASYSAVRRISATASVNCSQLLTSASSCFRPWGVRA